MKKYKLSLIVAGIFGIVAGLIVWKLPAFINSAFILAAVLTGFLVGKKNAQDGVDKLTK